MAIAVQIDIPGATLERYDQAVEIAGFLPGGPLPPGALFHWVAETNAGIRIVNVWESREGYDQFAARQAEIVQEVGVDLASIKLEFLRGAQLSQWHRDAELNHVTSDQMPRPQSISLAEEQSKLTRARIRRAAMDVVARRGFDATVDEIAQVSAVSPRTIFRHYLSHDRLIAETVRDMFEESGRYPDVGSPRDVDEIATWIDGLPQEVADVDSWLEALAVTVHTRMAEVFGSAFWDIYAPPRPGSEALAEVAELCRAYRMRGTHYMADLAWRSAGGAGEPPEDLTLAFALHLSAHTTQALMADFDQTPAQIGALTADILKTLLWRAVQTQRRS